MKEIIFKNLTFEQKAFAYKFGFIALVEAFFTDLSKSEQSFVAKDLENQYKEIKSKFSTKKKF